MGFKGLYEKNCYDKFSYLVPECTKSVIVFIRLNAANHAYNIL